jgi:hypothetical protein
MKPILLVGVCIGALGAWAGDGPQPSSPQPGTFIVVQSSGGGGSSTGSGFVQPPAPPPPFAESLPDGPEKQVIADQKSMMDAEAHARGQDRVFADRLYKIVNEQRRNAGNVLVRSNETDPKSLANAEEDLSVMSHILEKAMQPKDEGDERRVMGVVIPGDGSARNLQIQGYGAIFMLQVNFPLSGPPAKPAGEQPAEPVNSTWEEAKRELYGSPRPELPYSDHWEEATGAYMRVFAGQPEYDPKRVEELEESLLATLKNASNIRSLKESESVTVVVTSAVGRGAGLPQQPVRELRTMSASGQLRVEIASSEDDAKPEQRAASTLTISAKKSDIDAFAKGKLTQEEFRKRATVTVY